MAIITQAELEKLSDETLVFLVGLAENAGEAGELGASRIRTEQARRARVKLAASREKAQRTVLMDEWTVTMVPRTWEQGYSREYGQNARVYVSIDGLEKVFPELAASEAALPAPKDKGEDPANDRAYNKHNRLIARLAKRVGMEAVVALIETGKVNRVGEELRAKFSVYAGCSSCPCSPGLVLNQLLFMAANDRRCDIYVSKTLAS